MMAARRLRSVSKLVVEPRVAHGNSGLVRKALQELPVHFREGIFGAKQKDDAQQLVLEKQRQTHDLPQRDAQLLFHLAHA